MTEQPRRNRDTSAATRAAQATYARRRAARAATALTELDPDLWHPETRVMLTALGKRALAEIEKTR